MDTSKLPKTLIRNVIAIVVFIIVGVTALSVSLSLITRHGRSVEVPDMVGLQIEDAEMLAKEAHVRLEIEDSTFVSVVDRGAVFMQDPAAGSQVKKGRHIRLIVNTMAPRKVRMPDVTDCPVRQAVSDLTSKGFRVGRLYYEPGFDDRVTAQLKDGRPVKPGSTVDSGSVIDLKVGFNSQYSTVTVPGVVGKKSAQATRELQEHSLNVKVSYDNSVLTREDKVKAVVVKQSPAAGAKGVSKGSFVSLTLSVDPEKISK